MWWKRYLRAPLWAWLTLTAPFSSSFQSNSSVKSTEAALLKSTAGCLTQIHYSGGDFWKNITKNRSNKSINGVRVTLLSLSGAYQWATCDTSDWRQKESVSLQVVFSDFSETLLWFIAEWRTLIPFPFQLSSYQQFYLKCSLPRIAFEGPGLNSTKHRSFQRLAESLPVI